MSCTVEQAVGPHAVPLLLGVVDGVAVGTPVGARWTIRRARLAARRRDAPRCRRPASPDVRAGRCSPGVTACCSASTSAMPSSSSSGSTSAHCRTARRAPRRASDVDLPRDPLGDRPVPEPPVDGPLGGDEERRHLAGGDGGLELRLHEPAAGGRAGCGSGARSPASGTTPAPRRARAAAASTGTSRVVPHCVPPSTATHVRSRSWCSAVPLDLLVGDLAVGEERRHHPRGGSARISSSVSGCLTSCSASAMARRR